MAYLKKEDKINTEFLNRREHYEKNKKIFIIHHHTVHSADDRLYLQIPDTLLMTMVTLPIIPKRKSPLSSREISACITTTALNYTLPAGWQLVDIYGDKCALRHIETQVPFYLTVKNGPKENVISAFSEALEASNTYTEGYALIYQMDVNLSGFDCALWRESDHYSQIDNRPESIEYDNFCYTDYYGNTLEIRVAQDDIYIIPPDTAIEDYVPSESVSKALSNSSYFKDFCKEILSGVHDD